MDVCKVCGGKGVLPGNCDCAGNKLDCEGVCGGKKVWGVCGECLTAAEHESLIPGANGSKVVERYPEGCCDCDGSVKGCDGLCGSGAVLDVCKVCKGLGLAPGKCDCEGNTLDCNGNCGGDDSLDVCGRCNGPGYAPGTCDCDGNKADECGVCNGKGIPKGYCSCDGE